MHYYEKLVVYTLYPQNLTNGYDSFKPSITLKDFTRNIDYVNLKEAKIITYINPKGTSFILRDKNGSKT